MSGSNRIDSDRTGTGRAAEVVRSGFDAMADDLAPAVLAHRSESVNGAFEAVEDVPLFPHPDFKGLVIVIAAHFTLGHRALLLHLTAS
jgi:hypothetical protein